MTTKNLHKLSKFLSLILRHNPKAAGVVLDSAGWCEVSSLLVGLNKNGHSVNQSDLDAVVASDEKGRYSYNAQKTHIRANQGHSISVDLGLEPVIPPEVLYHGTVDRFLISIKSEGLKKMQRHHVHLSSDEKTAKNVGGRRGEAVVLKIRAKEMHDQGIKFFLSANGVWLVDAVAPSFIDFC